MFIALNTEQTLHAIYENCDVYKVLQETYACEILSQSATSCSVKGFTEDKQFF
jgi:hypothetical protein